MCENTPGVGRRRCKTLMSVGRLAGHGILVGPQGVHPRTPTSRLIGHRRRCAAVVVYGSSLARVQDDPSRGDESQGFGKPNIT